MSDTDTHTPTCTYICAGCGFRAYYLGFRWGMVEFQIAGPVPGRKTERQGLICPRCNGTDVSVEAVEFVEEEENNE